MKREILGEEIAYDDNQKDAPVLFLIHGNMSAKECFYNIEKYLGERRIIAFDLPGFGDSSFNYFYYSIDQLAWVCYRFIKSFGIKKFDILGWSMGGAIIYELFKTRLEENIDHAIFISAMGINGVNRLDDNYKSFLDTMHLTNIPTEIMNGITVYQEELRKLYSLKPSYESSFTRESMRHMLKRYVFNEKHDHHTLERSTKLALKQRDPMDINKAIMSYTYKGETVPKIKKLFLHGSEDKVVRLEKIEETYEFFKDSSTLKIIPGYDHGMVLTHAKEISEEVNKFLEN